MLGGPGGVGALKVNVPPARTVAPAVCVYAVRSDPRFQALIGKIGA